MAKLNLIYNEAVRQEALRTYSTALAFHNPEMASEKLAQMLKVHGPYTEGFYEKEWAALQERLKGKAGE